MALVDLVLSREGVRLSGGGFDELIRRLVYDIS